MGLTTPSNNFIWGLGKQVAEGTPLTVEEYGLPVYSGRSQPVQSTARVEVTDATAMAGDSYKQGDDPLGGRRRRPRVRRAAPPDPDRALADRHEDRRRPVRAHDAGTRRSDQHLVRRRTTPTSSAARSRSSSRPVSMLAVLDLGRQHRGAGEDRRAILREASDDRDVHERDAAGRRYRRLLHLQRRDGPVRGRLDDARDGDERPELRPDGRATRDDPADGRLGLGQLPRAREGRAVDHDDPADATTTRRTGRRSTAPSAARSRRPSASPARSRSTSSTRITGGHTCVFQMAQGDPPGGSSAARPGRGSADRDRSTARWRSRRPAITSSRSSRTR